MYTEQINWLIWIVCFIVVPISLYHGFRLLTDKKYFMRVSGIYIGDDVENEYKKISSSDIHLHRYNKGFRALALGIIMFIMFISTFVVEINSIIYDWKFLRMLQQ